jgi:hypothetical protein
VTGDGSIVEVAVYVRKNTRAGIEYSLVSGQEALSAKIT